MRVYAARVYRHGHPTEHEGCAPTTLALDSLIEGLSALSKRDYEPLTAAHRFRLESAANEVVSLFDLRDNRNGIRIVSADIDV